VQTDHHRRRAEPKEEELGPAGATAAEREGRFCTRTWGVGTGVEGSSRRRLLSREEDVGVGIGSPDILAGDVGSLTHGSDFTHQ
jgi:hypothetical protein